MAAQPALDIDILKTSQQNILALVHYTFPRSTGVVNLTDFTYVTSATSGDPIYNSTLTVTSLETAQVTGDKVLKYNRVDISKEGPLLLPAGSVIVTHLESIFGSLLASELTTSTLAGELEGLVVTAKPTSSLYIGSFEITVETSVFNVNTLLSGDELDGFGV